MDIVFIEALAIDTYVGIYDWEQARKQTIVLDLEMNADIAKAAQTDTIENTLNYKKVAKMLIAFVDSGRFQLVETIAERCAELVLDNFPEVSWLRLKVSKPGAVRGSKNVGVIIERGQKS